MSKPLAVTTFITGTALFLGNEVASFALAASPLVRVVAEDGPLKVAIRAEIDVGDGQWRPLREDEVVKEGQSVRLLLSSPSSNTLRAPVHAYGTLVGPTGGCHGLSGLPLLTPAEVGWGPMRADSTDGIVTIYLLVVEGALTSDDERTWNYSVGCRPAGLGGGRHGSATRGFTLSQPAIQVRGTVEGARTIALDFRVETGGPADRETPIPAPQNGGTGVRTR